MQISSETHLEVAAHVDREDEEHVGRGAEGLVELGLVVALRRPHAVGHSPLDVLVVNALQNEVLADAARAPRALYNVAKSKLPCTSLRTPTRLPDKAVFEP